MADATVAPVWVCLCEAVTSGRIAEAIEAGARSVKDVGDVTGAGTVCNRCTRNIKVLIDQHDSEEKAATQAWRRRRTLKS
jgi:bacterioferritin-associated ferredoxin